MEAPLAAAAARLAPAFRAPAARMAPDVAGDVLVARRRPERSVRGAGSGRDDGADPRPRQRGYLLIVRVRADLACHEGDGLQLDASSQRPSLGRPAGPVRFLSRADRAFESRAVRRLSC